MVLTTDKAVSSCNCSKRNRLHGSLQPAFFSLYLKELNDFVPLFLRPLSILLHIGRTSLPVPVTDGDLPFLPVVGFDVGQRGVWHSNPQSQELSPAQRKLGEIVPAANVHKCMLEILPPSILLNLLWKTSSLISRNLISSFLLDLLCVCVCTHLCVCVCVCVCVYKALPPKKKDQHEKKWFPRLFAHCSVLSDKKTLFKKK